MWMDRSSLLHNTAYLLCSSAALTSDGLMRMRFMVAWDGRGVVESVCARSEMR